MDLNFFSGSFVKNKFVRHYNQQHNTIGGGQNVFDKKLLSTPAMVRNGATFLQDFN